ncbi:4-amino-4-deoxychorismate lyase [Shewanella sairae]|uniref:Aminodeoxychorismate lyase n=1 Tax=Shewanella sairae TaxID=190310 RepID=A0ABQ4PJI2_9GAMM|nr:aminodeoxychorismate lyase [Shewanella sairae]MCL1130319.1 aminodeoxychorismate lyase [Shewanella sairae]GIU47886.1 4-amino-4-deoxychorismate lyase [Shewanella sairae]
MAQVWVNGEFDIGVSPLDRGLAYGDGLFATMRVNQGHILFLDEHMERLTQGAFRLGFSWTPSAALYSHLTTLAQANPQSCIKLILSRGAGGRGYGVELNRVNQAFTQYDLSSAAKSGSQHETASNNSLNVTEVISLSGLPEHYQNWQQQGICLARSEVLLGKQPKLAGIKHCNRLEQVLIKSAVLPLGYQDWLVVDSSNNMIESSMANIFFVIEDKIMTPRISHAGVAGMMREQLIYQLLGRGFKVEITDIDYDKLSSVKHAFISNSLFGLVDVVAIDSFTFERAVWTSSLREHLSLTL